MNTGSYSGPNHVTVKPTKTQSLQNREILSIFDHLVQKM